MSTLEENNNHRKVLALIICLFLAFIYVETVWKPYFNPQPANQQKGPSAQQTPGQAPLPAETQAPSATTAPAAEERVQPGTSGYPTDEQIREKGRVQVETGTLTAQISLLGGRLTSVLLRNYAIDLKEPEIKLDMVKHADSRPYPLGLYSGAVNDSQTVYHLVSNGQRPGEDGVSKIDVSGEAKATVALEGALPDGRTVRKEFTFTGQDYLLGVKAVVAAGAEGPAGVALEWTKVVDEQEASILDPYDVRGFVAYGGEKAQRVPFKDVASSILNLGPVYWVSITDKYFVSSMIAAELLPATARKEGSVYATQMIAEGPELDVRLYIGPKNYEMLAAAGAELQKNIDFGRTVLIAAPLLFLLQFFYKFLGNYGLAIVALTIVVRMLLYPLNVASFKQMKAMQDLKPELDRIREQVKDKQRQQMEQMALYKKRGVNPLGGCFPVLIQMPVFIGLYSALMLAVDLRHAPYALWIKDLSAPEKLYLGGIGVPVLVILFVLSMLLQQWTTPSTMDPAQKKAMLIMPIVFGFMFVNFPAGLALYWLTNNIISIGQQRALQRGETTTMQALTITLGVCALVFFFAFIVTLL